MVYYINEQGTDLSLFLFSILSGCSCKDDPPTPADSTPNVPSNEVTAMVDGVLWETFAPIGQQEIQAQHYLGNYFDIDARKYVSQGVSHIYMKVYNLNDTGDYQLSDLDFGEYYDAEQNRHFQASVVYTGNLHVSTFNYTDAKISAEFYFIGRDTVSGDTVAISDGRIINVSFYKYWFYRYPTFSEPKF